MTNYPKRQRGRSGEKKGRMSSVRVIGGQWRGSRIEFAEAQGLRPTSDRIRETLFNWLSADMADARCLDLFAGSGVLAFEALSRGALEVYALEKNTTVYQRILANCERLRAHDLSLLNVDSADWLRGEASEGDHPQNGGFDIAFVDPPFHDDIDPQLLTLLESSGVLLPHAKIYLEQRAATDGWQIPAGWEILRDKKAGSVRFSLYQRPA